MYSHILKYEWERFEKCKLMFGTKKITYYFYLVCSTALFFAVKKAKENWFMSGNGFMPCHLSA